MIDFGKQLIYLDSVGSTNNYLAEHADLDSLAEGTAILTYDQHDGKGQLDRVWTMNSGQDLAISYLVRPGLRPADLFTLNKAVGLAVHSVISELVSGETKLKWPNDVLVNDKKVAGILIEPTWQGGQCKQVIVGIGINVNGDFSSFPFSATSLREIMGMEISQMDVVSCLNKHMTIHHHAFAQNSTQVLAEKYDNLLYGSGQEVKYSTKDTLGSFGKVVGVDGLGRIVLQTKERQVAFSHGEIEIDYLGIE